MKKLISIIIPIFNAKEIIQPTLNSILDQTYSNFEILFINDASTDTSLKIIKRYMLQDKRIKIINTNGEGFAFGKNTGIKASKGNYIIFFKIGNIMSQNLLEYLLEILEQNNGQISTCNYFNITEPDFYDYSLTEPIQNKEELKILTSQEYLQNLGSEDNHIFKCTCNLWNKLIYKPILTNFNFDTNKYYSDVFACIELYKNAQNIIHSNQILIANTLFDEHINMHCFSYNDLEKIEFLQKIFKGFRNKNKTIEIKNTAIRILETLYEIRTKLTSYYTNIYDLEEQKKDTDQKFSSIRKFLNTHYSENAIEYSKYFDLYKELLEDEKFKQKYYFLYSQSPLKYENFDSLDFLNI